MQFGLCVATKIDDWQLIKDAEALGYHRAWVPDSQMIWSDCYATLALAAPRHRPRKSSRITYRLEASIKHR